MSARDIGLFLRSARTDARIEALRPSLGAAAALETVYAETGDPWASGAAQYRYQARKYEVLAGLLPDRRFESALDLGCGLGLLSRHLALRADRVLGVDIAPSALVHAARRHADIPNLRFACHDVLALPEDLDGGFDLLAVADVLYYLQPLPDALLKSLAMRFARLLRPGGMLMLANHYFFRADPESRRSRRIHDAFAWCPELQVTAEYRRPFYITTLLERPATAQPPL